MGNSTINYLTNLLRLLRGNRALRPLVAVYHVTAQCNLNCAYCEDFGRRRNATATPALPLEDALQVLRTIRSGTDRLILTGGEPLLYPEIESLVHRARRELGFRHLTLFSNGLLLPQHEALLSDVDRLVVSLDSVDTDRWSSLIGVPPESARAVLDNVRHYAGRQREFGFRLILNCVLTPETLGEPSGEALPGAEQVLAFCREHGLLVSFSPQSVNNWPRYELLVSERYEALVGELMAHKRRGAPILGSLAYLRTTLELRPYSCYPALVPRIMPNGELVYPCWPVEKEGYAHGGRPVNLLQVQSWAEVLRQAVAAFDEPPRVCSSCYQQCYAEPSLMQSRPLSFLGEWLRYRASRRGGLATHAPG